MCAAILHPVMDMYLDWTLTLSHWQHKGDLPPSSMHDAWSRALGCSRLLRPVTIRERAADDRLV